MMSGSVQVITKLISTVKLKIKYPYVNVKDPLGQKVLLISWKTFPNSTLEEWHLINELVLSRKIDSCLVQASFMFEVWHVWDNLF
jgi:hypothetical protein